MKKILLMLATEKGVGILKQIASSQYVKYIGAIVSFHEINVLHDSYYDIQKIADEINIEFHDWNKFKSNPERFVSEGKFTEIIAVGWRYIIPLALNRFLDNPVMIFHDSLLPKYRGFAPVVTAMLCGEKTIGASVIFAGETPDNGDIICQESIMLNGDEYISDVISSMTDVYKRLFNRLIADIVSDSVEGHPQNDSEATFSIWRDEDDYLIDWNMDADEILTMIRALGFPYRGAKSIYNGDIIRILKAEKAEQDLNFAIRDVGKIWELKDGIPVVICKKGLIRIESATDEAGNPYLFRYLRRRLG